MIDKHTLKHVTGEWYLWHHIKNEDALIPVIISSFLTLFCKGGGEIVSICIWVWYFYHCAQNNEKLNNDPEIVREREWWLQKRKEQGVLEEYKRILGI